MLLISFRLEQRLITTLLIIIGIGTLGCTDQTATTHSKQVTTQPGKSAETINTAEYSIELLSAGDGKYAGVTHYIVSYKVCHTRTAYCVTIDCILRDSNSWILEPNISNDADKIGSQLITQAIILSVEALYRHVLPKRVSILNYMLHLEPVTMPQDYRLAFYKDIAAQMRGLTSKPIDFDDPRVRDMVRKAYKRSEYVQNILNGIKERGYEVPLMGLHELCSLDYSAVKDLTWKEIADLPSVGLNSSVLTCCILIARPAQQSKP